MRHTKPPRLFVVIHAQNMATNDYSLTHVLSHTEMAIENSADGVFLIPDYENEFTGRNRRATPEDIVFYYKEIKKEFPDFPVGVNFLLLFKRMDTILIEQIKETVFDMIQSDGSFEQVLPLSEMVSTEFFPGLAFKYSKHENATGAVLKELCEKLPSGKNIIPTTSGPATGIAADVGKIQEIRTYLSADRRLGIASGITLENVDSFLTAGVTDFLVATWLRKEVNEGYDMLDSDKICQLANRIHA
jgi:hypothetical protein